MSDVTIKIVADDSEVAATTQRAADSVESMGESFGRASGQVNRAQMELVRISTHITGEAIPGFSRMGREIASVGAEAMGVGPMLAAAIPIAALVAGYEVMEHLATATLKEKTAAASLAVENGKLNDKLMEEKEAFIGLTQGPLAEAIQKSKDYKETISGLPELVDQFNKRLDEQVGFWDKLAIKAEKAGVAIKNVIAAQGAAEGGIDIGKVIPEKGPMDTDEIKTRVQELKAAYSQTKDLTTATKELKSLETEVRSRGGAGLEDRIIPIKEFQAQLQTVTDTAAQHQKNINAGVAKDDYDQQVKVIKDVEEVKKKLKEEGIRPTATAEMGPRQSFYDMPKFAPTPQPTQEEGTTAKLPGAGMAAPSIMPDDKQTEQQLGAAMKGLQELRDATETQWDGMNQTIYKSLDDRLNYVKANANLMEQANTQMWNQIHAAEQKAVNLAEDTFNKNMMSYMKGTETLKSVFLQTWATVAESAITNLMKMGEASLEQLAIGKTVALKQIAMDASQAASGAYKAVVGTPYVGPVLAPIAAGAAFAAVMGFGAMGIAERGGISEGGLTMLHPKEMVLPPKLSEFVQKSAAAAAPGGEGGGDTHNYNFQGMQVHSSNAKEFATQLKTMVRRGQLKF